MPPLSRFPGPDDRAFWDQQNRRAAEDECRQKLRVADQIISDAELPKHHVGAVAGAWGQEWKDTGRFLKGRLGIGFIHALVGSRGCGKTELAVALAVVGAKERLLRSRYTTATMMLAELRATPFDPEARRRVWNKYTLPALLIVDEVCETSLDASDARTFVEVVDARYRSKGKDTLLVSNNSQENFEALVGLSVVSRMQERGGVIVCDWPGYRQQGA